MGNIVAKFPKQKRFNKYSRMKNLMQQTIQLTIFIVVLNDCQAKTSWKKYSWTKRIEKCKIQKLTGEGRQHCCINKLMMFTAYTSSAGASRIIDSPNCQKASSSLFKRWSNSIMGMELPILLDKKVKTRSYAEIKNEKEIGWKKNDSFI